MMFGIDVIIVAPGAVKTPIWGKAEDVDISAYKNSPFYPPLERIRKYMLQLGENGLPTEQIDAVIAALGHALLAEPDADCVHHRRRAAQIDVHVAAIQVVSFDMGRDMALARMGAICT